MDAVQMHDGVAVIDLKRCIGCGLCVTTCVTNAIDLLRKDEKDSYIPPMYIDETYMRIAEERGLIK